MMVFWRARNDDNIGPAATDRDHLLAWFSASLLTSDVNDLSRDSHSPVRRADLHTTKERCACEGTVHKQLKSFVKFSSVFGGNCVVSSYRRCCCCCCRSGHTRRGRRRRDMKSGGNVKIPSSPTAQVHHPVAAHWPYYLYKNNSQY